MSMGKLESRAVSLFEAGAQSGLSATGGRGDTDGLTTIGVAGPNSQSFSYLGPAALAERAPMLYLCSIELRPNDLALPRNPRRTDDLPPNLENKSAARLRGLSAHAPERRVIWRKVQ